MKRSEVWLGDLLRVFEELRPGEQESAAIARMLKLEQTSTTPEALRLQGAWSAAAAPGRVTAVTPTVRLPQEERERPRSDLAASSTSRSQMQLKQITTGSGSIATPHWVPLTATMPPPRIMPMSPPAPQPLIGKRVRRAIFCSALATRMSDGPPDIDQILERFTSCRPLTDLPRLAERTLRYGVQVLVDCWIGMAPFSADQQSVLKAIRELFAPDRFEQLRFAGCPSRGVGPGARKDRRPWKPPRRRTPILLLSDLGIGGPMLDPDGSDPIEWLAFARKVREAGCPLIAFVPYEPRRWPKDLARSMTLVHWSERLTVGAIRRVAERGLAL